MATTATNPDGSRRDRTDQLARAVYHREMWPTPRANSAMAATITEGADSDRYPNLETVVKKRDPSVVGGALNPTWVEWLMGFPSGWTDLDHSATPSCPK
jgi:hypothetical protein